ncbi:pyrroline-5-carboxylate reductase dimerization domain-containing protein [Bosea sp. TWI1241]|uniref:pyrroline-5-carboxylate reductase family protein n=1 Tax=Bosea sp. TWI1241 TaxID=3148904 RepID=UPI00320A32EB
MTRIGFIGVGHLAEELIAGWLRSGVPAERMILSPRGHGRDLAERHGITLAADNDAVVAGADIVVLATRPTDAVAAVAGLGWRAGQLLVSACAGVPLDALRSAVAPAAPVRIMPLTAASIGASPTTVYPDLPALRPLLVRLGPVIPLAGEAQFEVATVSAAIYGWAQMLIGLGRDWSVAQGLSEQAARQLAATTFVAAGRMVAERPEPVEELLASLVTPGGITERGLSVLSEDGVPQGWERACDAVLAKLTAGSGRAPG